MDINEYEDNQFDLNWEYENDENKSQLYRINSQDSNNDFYVPQQQLAVQQYENEMLNECFSFVKPAEIFCENPQPPTKDFEYTDESENQNHEEQIQEEENTDENEVKKEFEYDEMQVKSTEDNKSTKIILQMKQIRKQPKENHKLIDTSIKQKKGVSAEQVETKNLAAFYARFIIKSIKRQENVTLDTQKTLQKFEKKVKTCTLKTLRDLLDDETIRQSAQQYFCNFEFLDDLLSSDKQQDIKTPIKYLNKMYQGCLNREKLNNWKEQ